MGGYLYNTSLATTVVFSNDCCTCQEHGAQVLFSLRTKYSSLVCSSFNEDSAKGACLLPHECQQVRAHEKANSITCTPQNTNMSSGETDGQLDSNLTSHAQLVVD